MESNVANSSSERSPQGAKNLFAMFSPQTNHAEEAQVTVDEVTQTYNPLWQKIERVVKAEEVAAKAEEERRAAEEATAEMEEAGEVVAEWRQVVTTSGLKASSSSAVYEGHQLV